MPTINVSLKEGASADQLDAAKKQCSDQGGKIVHEFKLVKGFTYVTPIRSGTIPRQYSRHRFPKWNDTENRADKVFFAHIRAEFPADKVHTLSSNEHINVEDDKQVTTQ
ncbi:hypothetical protein D0869_08161 [Hortaea werneckii]|uniref:Inhibitor I9 domain-containing protein n=1 Tax=Hortaea werneckii TaxID=91943 RepID=A0A3M6YF70_HORWE|nr:hypothetical protein D0869_08161 [Hortaea werneckii]RMY00555.1 hypothetical protein D0868_08941 [Hortaea werneckii]RMY01593.1 hypothetical protein D0867_11339 [Hortaea werneckii]RMY21640.1 hypothetical protein D0866_12197 [Hortaea werneckii]